QAAIARSEDVDPAFGALQSEYLVAVGRWQEQARAAKLAGAAGHPPHALPRPPAPEFFPRFEALASRGSFAALRWCVQHSESELGAPDEVRGAKARRVRVLIDRIAAAEPHLA